VTPAVADLGGLPQQCRQVPRVGFYARHIVVASTLIDDFHQSHS
jgi:hypothetical protein